MANKIKLNLGCGIDLWRGYINVDIIDEAELKKGVKTKKGMWKHSRWPRGAKYVQADVRKLPFADNYADQVELFQVIEHMPFREVDLVLKEIRRVMKPGAKLLLTTDDFDGIALDWIRMRMSQFDLEKYQNVMETVYGNQAHMGEFHHNAMTPDFLNWAIVRAGFKKGSITKYARLTPVKKFGGMSKPKKGRVYRNDILYAEVEK